MYYYLQYHWRIGANGRYPGYPIEISRMWPGLPRNLTHVDAVYERPDHKIAIFVGMTYIYTFLKRLIVISNFYFKLQIIFRQATVLVRFTIFNSRIS